MQSTQEKYKLSRENPAKGNQTSQKFEKTVIGKRLETLDLYSLDRRRIGSDLIEPFKIFTRKYNINYKSFFTLAITDHLRETV